MVRWIGIIGGLALTACNSVISAPVGSFSGGSRTDALCTAEPGVTWDRRLTRNEYNRAIEQLVGDTSQPANSFPDDTKSFGFRNNANSQSVDDNTVRLYLQAASDIIGDTLSSNRRSRLMVCEPSGFSDRACIRSVLETFANSAWRRPATSAEVDALLSTVDTAQLGGLQLEEGVSMGLQAVLLSQNFMYRVEEDPERPTDYELASRLSFFLWGAPPDAELLSLAAAGTLNQTDTLRAQVQRMIADPKIAGLVDDFVYDWMELDKFDDIASSGGLGTGLKQSMRQEMVAFFEYLITSDQPLSELLLSQQSFVDATLSSYYGEPLGSAVSEQRRGLFGKGAFLATTSHLEETSPVKRGDWVLTNVLCTQPPPPPEDAGELTDPEPGENLTPRERLEQHRADPTCASCHDSIDPIGLALENYDWVGRWRDTYETGRDIDPTGVWVDGAPIEDLLDMADIIAADTNYESCMTEKFYTYATGRRPDGGDSCVIRETLEQVQAGGNTFGQLLENIVLSEAFRGEQE